MAVLAPAALAVSAVAHLRGAGRRAVARTALYFLPTFCLLLAAYYLLPATRYLLLTTCYLLLATCHY